MPTAREKKTSDRRQKVLRLRQAGLSVATIAARVGASEATVNFDLHYLSMTLPAEERANLRRRRGERATQRYTDNGPHEPPAYAGPKPEGAAEYRCCWCGHWTQDMPLSVCGNCLRWYQEQTADMPKDEEDAA